MTDFILIVLAGITPAFTKAKQNPETKLKQD